MSNVANAPQKKAKVALIISCMLLVAAVAAALICIFALPTPQASAPDGETEILDASDVSMPEDPVPYVAEDDASDTAEEEEVTIANIHIPLPDGWDGVSGYNMLGTLEIRSYPAEGAPADSADASPATNSADSIPDVIVIDGKRYLRGDVTQEALIFGEDEGADSASLASQGYEVISKIEGVMLDADYSIEVPASEIEEGNLIVVVMTSPILVRVSDDEITAITVGPISYGVTSEMALAALRGEPVVYDADAQVTFIPEIADGAFTAVGGASGSLPEDVPIPSNN